MNKKLPAIFFLLQLHRNYGNVNRYCRIRLWILRGSCSSIRCSKMKLSRYLRWLVLHVLQQCSVLAHMLQPSTSLFASRIEWSNENIGTNGSLAQQNICNVLLRVHKTNCYQQRIHDKRMSATTTNTRRNKKTMPTCVLWLPTNTNHTCPHRLRCNKNQNWVTEAHLYDKIHCSSGDFSASLISFCASSPSLLFFSSSNSIHEDYLL